MISAYAVIGGKKQHLGTEAVLSRWHVAGCANCQTHLEAKAFIAFPQPREKTGHDTHVEVELRTRDGLLGQQPQAFAVSEQSARGTRKMFRFEVR